MSTHESQQPVDPVTAASADTVQQDDNSVTLDDPLTRGKQTISTITLRKPRGGDLRGLNLVDVANLNVSALQKLLPRISDPILTEHEVSSMGPADLLALGAKVAYFLLSKQEKTQFQ